jgi:hypothetical protein
MADDDLKFPPFPDVPPFEGILVQFASKGENPAQTCFEGEHCWGNAVLASPCQCGKMVLIAMSDGDGDDERYYLTTYPAEKMPPDSGCMFALSYSPGTPTFLGESESSDTEERSFGAIKHRLGGYGDDELRRLLVSIGAVRFEGKGGEELWGLLNRNEI